MASPLATHVHVLTGVTHRLLAMAHMSEDEKRLIAESLSITGHNADVDEEALSAAIAATLDRRAKDPTVTGVLNPSTVPGQTQSAESVAVNARIDALNDKFEQLLTLLQNAAAQPPAAVDAPSVSEPATTRTRKKNGSSESVTEL